MEEWVYVDADSSDGGLAIIDDVFLLSFVVWLEIVRRR